MAEREILTNQEVALILRSADLINRARIFEGASQHPFSIQRMVIDLTTAKLSTAPLKIGFPFKSVFVETASDSAVAVSMQIGSMDSFQSVMNLSKRDSYASDIPLAEAYLSWAAQSGKSITLVFFTDGKFQSGSYTNSISGSVNVGEGTAASGITSVNLAAATAAAIAPANSSRIVSTFQNKTGADLYVSGDNALTDDGTPATAGIKYSADAIFEWRNTAALYGYSVAGGRVNRIDQT